MTFLSTQISHASLPFPRTDASEISLPKSQPPTHDQEA
jgi:hypothetical protein